MSDEAAADEIRRAEKKAMDLLLDMDRTEKELREKLERKGFSAQAAERAVEYAKKYGYADDARFADHYIEIHRTDRSRRRIRYDMEKKGFPRDVIDAAFDKAGFYDERPVIRALAKKKMRNMDPGDPKTWMKLASYLSRQGFSAGDIYAVLDDIRSLRSGQGEDA